MPKFILPDDFQPNAQKTYTEGDVTFEVWVQFKGLQTGGGQAPHYLWLFAILVNSKIVEAGPFRWDPSERHMTDLAVCNNLATFYGASPQVQDPNYVPLELDPEPPKLRLVPSAVQGPTDAENFILRALALVWSIWYHPISSKGDKPTETLFVVSYSDVGGNYCVMIGTKANPAVTYEVLYTKENSKTTAIAYIETDKYEFAEDDFE